MDNDHFAVVVPFWATWPYETMIISKRHFGNILSMNKEEIKAFAEIIKGKFPSLEMSVSGKGGSVRTVYFSSRALQWLGRYLKVRIGDMHTPLFISYGKGSSGPDRRLTPRSVERAVRRYATMAGLPVDATPHTLRHSFATDLLNEGADMRSVQELLGHKNIVTTQIYTHVTNKKLRDIHSKFHSGQK